METNRNTRRWASKLIWILAGLLASAPRIHASRPQGVVVAWGSLGQDAVPSGLTNVVAVAAGFGHALALKVDGTVTGWGSASFNAATPPAGLSNVVAIAAGTDTSVALTADGKEYAWAR